MALSFFDLQLSPFDVFSFLKFFAMQKLNIQNGIGSGQMLSFDSNTCPTACKSVGILFHHLFGENGFALEREMG
jgi:hypothetical protein